MGKRIPEILEALPQKSDKREKRRKQNKKHKGNNDDFDVDELGELPVPEKTSTQEGLLNAEKKSLNSKRLTEIEKVLDDSSLDDNKKHELIKSIEAGYQKRLSELEKEEADDVADLPEVEIGDEVSDEVESEENKNIFDRKVIISDFNSFFDELRKKLVNFEKIFSKDDEEFCEKLEKNINYWARKIKEFEGIENPNEEELTEIMQLHDEIKELINEDWVDLHKKGLLSLNAYQYKKNLKKINKEFNKEDDAEPFPNLTEEGLYGDNSFVIENVNRDAKKQVIEGLENKYGKVGKNYFKYDAAGNLVEKITIRKYELGGIDNNFVYVDSKLKSKTIEKKINLNEFKSFLADYIKEDLLNIETEEDGNERLNPSEAVGKILEKELAGDVLKDLSHEEISGKKENEVETVDIKLEKISNSLYELNDKFKYFVLKNKGELFNKELLKRIHLLQDEVITVQKIKGEGTGKKGLLDDLYSRINGLIIENWEESLIEFKKSQEQEEVEFNEQEMDIIEKTKKIALAFIEKSKNEFDWTNFPKGRLDMVLEIQAVAFLMQKFKENKIFINKEEKVAEFIVENKNN